MAHFSWGYCCTPNKLICSYTRLLGADIWRVAAVWWRMSSALCILDRPSDSLSRVILCCWICCSCVCVFVDNWNPLIETLIGVKHRSVRVGGEFDWLYVCRWPRCCRGWLRVVFCQGLFRFALCAFGVDWSLTTAMLFMLMMMVHTRTV